MKRANVLAISLFAVFLLSATLVSLAAAQNASADPTEAPDVAATPEPDAADLAANSTGVPDNGDILYSTQDNSTDTNGGQVPGEAQQNQVTAQTSSTDYILPTVAGAVAIAAVVGIAGMVFYRKKVANAQP